MKWTGNIASAYVGGDGSINNPYQIALGSQLAYLAQEVNNGQNYYNEYFILIADINLNNIEWMPIGGLRRCFEHKYKKGKYEHEISSFEGTFNGQGHSISNLYINDNNQGKEVGLFGYILDAFIKNIRIINANVIGTEHVGSLIGMAKNTVIVRCCASGSVDGKTYAGGLVGSQTHGFIVNSYASVETKSIDYSIRNGAGGLVGDADMVTVINCYATGNVEGDRVGGLVGYAGYSNISNCYAMGNVESHYGRSGGLVGYAYSGDIINCYATGNVIGEEAGGLVGYMNGSPNINNCLSIGQVSGRSYKGNILGCTFPIKTLYNNYSQKSHLSGVEAANTRNGAKWTPASEFLKRKDVEPFVKWNFDTVWKFVGNETLPILRFSIDEKECIVNHFFAGGDGSESDPYQIATSEQLAYLSWMTNINGYWTSNYNWSQNKYFVLTADIDMSEKEWVPIGTFHSYEVFNHAPFKGIFDGKDYTISNLTTTSSKFDNIGIFGYIEKATIKNIKITNARITGTTVGGLVGSSSDSTIINCFVVGDIEGCYVGGLIGEATDTTIKYCNVNVASADSCECIGGLIASIKGKNSLLANCHTSCDIKGRNVGGLIGEAQEGVVIADCYSIGNIIGEYDSKKLEGSLGGLVGSAYDGKITDCYSSCNIKSKQIENKNYIGGLVGRSSAIAIANCLSIGMISDIIDVDNRKGNLIGEEYENLLTNNYSINSSFNDTKDSKDGAKWEAGQAEPFNSWNNEYWKFADKSILPTLKAYDED